MKEEEKESINHLKGFNVSATFFSFSFVSVEVSSFLFLFFYFSSSVPSSSFLPSFDLMKSEVDEETVIRDGFINPASKLPKFQKIAKISEIFLKIAMIFIYFHKFQIIFIPKFESLGKREC